MERVTGNDPVSTVWKTVALPLSYARRLAEGRRHDHHAVASAMPLAGAAGASPVDLP